MRQRAGVQRIAPLLRAIQALLLSHGWYHGLGCALPCAARELCAFLTVNTYELIFSAHDIQSLDTEH